MTALDIKGVGDLIKSVGPTDEHRQKFGQTFLGGLVGQTIAFVGMMVAYVAAIVGLWKYASEELRALHEAVGAIAFWTIIVAPLVCILLFSMVPTAWRAFRERRLKAAAIGGDVQFKPGYFRLHPYGAADRDDFKRLDAADAVMSSLLAANVLPRLRDQGWTVVETRLFGDPIERLRAALIDADGLFTKKPAGDISLRELFERAAAARLRKGGAPLLLVIDQFEEFLVLHGEEERGPFTAFLSDLVKRPIDGVRLLLVFRSDYRPLVFKLDLPPLVADENWKELAPYDRGEATAFLQSGGRELSPSALDRLFRGLNDIEDAPGLYRPITLNMVGLVLERMGSALEGNPARLIQSYLTTCLSHGESRDFAKPLLANMITDAGTKEPHTEAELAALTQLQPWQIRAALADLARQGLVRRLEAATPVWEIAHDFLARIIGQLIGRLKPTIFQRTRPFVAPVVLLGWVALVLLALPYAFTLQERAAEAALRRLGASFSDAGGGLLVSFGPRVTDEAFSAARAHLERVNPAEVRFSFPTIITSLEPLRGVTNLRELDLSRASRITSLEPLEGLANLRTLNLLGVTGITSLEPLKGLTNLSSLILTGVTRITSLEPVKGLANLRTLNLSQTPGITSLEPLKGLAHLSTLDLSRATGITSLELLRGLTSLSDLDLTDVPGIASLEPLKGLANLNTLNISGVRGITSLEPLKGKNVDVRGASGKLFATMK